MVLILCMNNYISVDFEKIRLSMQFYTLEWVEQKMTFTKMWIVKCLCKKFVGYQKHLR